MEKVILIRCGELTLKGLNRRTFENQLKRNINLKLKSFPENTVIFSQSRFYVETASEDFDFSFAASKIKTIPGIVSLSTAYKIKTDLDLILSSAEALMKEKIKYTSSDISFKISTRRGLKTFQHDSLSLNAIVGDHLLGVFKDKIHVDLGSPDFTIYIEVREDTYIYTDKILAAGGLPVGTGGRAMLLLSGGIDSPVAGYMISKRGVKLEAIHFYSYPYTSERAKLKVIKLAKMLGEYNNGIMLHVVSFTDIQLYLRDNFDVEYLTILMRRVMMQIAEKVSKETNCTALITGESIGQVASQTLDSLNVTNESVDCIVLRPLIGFDKTDIVEIAKKIDTFETSILPYEDCCTLFVAKHPKTKPKSKDIMEIESKYDNILELIKKAISSREILKL